MTTNNTSFGPVLWAGIKTALLIIPTILTIWLTLQVRAVDREPEIVCLTPDQCVMEVQGVWYRISGVIDMDAIVPQEFKLREVIRAQEAETATPTQEE